MGVKTPEEIGKIAIIKIIGGVTAEKLIDFAIFHNTIRLREVVFFQIEEIIIWGEDEIMRGFAINRIRGVGNPLFGVFLIFVQLRIMIGFNTIKTGFNLVFNHEDAVFAFDPEVDIVIAFANDGEIATKISNAENMQTPGINLGDIGNSRQVD